MDASQLAALDLPALHSRARGWDVLDPAQATNRFAARNLLAELQNRGDFRSVALSVELFDWLNDSTPAAMLKSFAA